MAIEHKDIADANLHEPKHIQGASTSDSGKVITPSAGTGGISVLRFLSFSDISDVQAAGPADENKVATVNSLGNLVFAFVDAANLTNLSAANVTYDNVASGLTATDAQAAIDEVEVRVDALEGNDVFTQQAAPTVLGQTISNPPTTAEVQAISDKVDELIGVLQTAGVLS